MRIEGSNRRLSLHWTSLAEGNANFPIVIVFRYADDHGASVRQSGSRPEIWRYEGIPEDQLDAYLTEQKG